MSGGLIQLVAYGQEDLFLTKNPQITFFKIVYRRHTNFAREHIEQQFINTPDFGKKSTCIIAKEGDLMGGIVLKIILPRIKNCGPNNKFAWIRRIGYAMIKYIEIEIDNKIIDRHYGEWLHLFSQLTTRNIDDHGLDKLIGNVPELTEFTSSKPEYTLYIPLQFWFCRTPGLAMPLVALQYSEIKINIEFYDLQDCYYLNPTHYIQCSDSFANFEKNESLYQNFNGIDRFGIFSHYDTLKKRSVPLTPA